MFHQEMSHVSLSYIDMAPPPVQECHYEIFVGCLVMVSIRAIIAC